MLEFWADDVISMEFWGSNCRHLSVLTQEAPNVAAVFAV